jgi:HAD superfamily hydrolase (TIGR01484 family)
VKPLSALPADEIRALRGVVFDLDDTLLDHGSLTEAAYSALFRLREAGLRLVACTGRPAGWGEVIQRQWPLDGTVVENGALSLVSVEQGHDLGASITAALSPATAWKARRVVALDALDRAARRARRDALLALAGELAARFPETALADDNDARVTDVTLDIGEYKRVSKAAVAAMRTIAQARGVRIVASSVHLHLTYEADEKASGTIRLLCRQFGEDATAARSRYAFVGDSGNDATPFAAFAVTLGVSNVRSHLHALSVPPRFIAESTMGSGFAEIAARLVELRAQA